MNIFVRYYLYYFSYLTQGELKMLFFFDISNTKVPVFTGFTSDLNSHETELCKPLKRHVSKELGEKENTFFALNIMKANNFFFKVINTFCIRRDSGFLSVYI